MWQSENCKPVLEPGREKLKSRLVQICSSGATDCRSGSERPARTWLYLQGAPQSNQQKRHNFHEKEAAERQLPKLGTSGKYFHLYFSLHKCLEIQLW